MENLRLLSIRKELRAFTLWIAQDSLGRKFYCFRLRPALSTDPEVRASLAKSLATFQGISSPYIARFYGIQGTEDLRALYEYDDGFFLSEVLASRGKLTLTEALEVGVKISEGLAVLHKAGLVTGGLSPDDILIVREGGVKILGIGLSQAIYQLGAPYRIWLDPLWIAPEMHVGRPLTPGADVYSIGLLLQKMVAGPYSAAERVALGSPKLEEIIKICLSTEPHSRYRNAHQVKMLLSEELRLIKEEKELKAAEEEEVFDWVALFLGAIALLAVVGVVILWTIVYYRYAGLL